MRGGISEEEAEISELVLSAEPELEVDIDEEEVSRDRGASQAMDELISKGNTPEEAMELLKELGVRCGWSVSPDGFVVDSELALALHNLLSKARTLEDEATEEGDDEEADRKFEQSDECFKKYQQLEERHRNIMLPTSDSLRDAITRMLEWDEDAKRDLAQANADALLEKNQDVKAKRVEARRVEAAIKVAKASADAAERRKLRDLRGELKKARFNSSEAERLAGIFRPDDGAEAEAARRKDIDIISTILPSARAGEEKFRALDWSDKHIREPVSLEIEVEGKKVPPFGHHRRYAKRGEEEFKMEAIRSLESVAEEAKDFRLQYVKSLFDDQAEFAICAKAAFSDFSKVIKFAKLIYGTFFDEVSISTSLADHYWEFRGGGGDVKCRYSALMARLKGGARRTEEGLVLDGKHGSFAELDPYPFGGPTCFEMYVKYENLNTGWAHVYDFSQNNLDDQVLVSNNSNDGKGQIHWQVDQGGSRKPLSKVSTCFDLAWVHVVVTACGSAMRIYKNGVLAETLTGAWEPNTLTRDHHCIGSEKGTSHFLAGTVAYFRAWHGRELTAAQVKALYDARNNY